MSYKNKGFGILAFVIAIAVAAAIGGGVYYKAAKSLPKIDTTVSATSTVRTNTNVNSNTNNGSGTTTVVAGSNVSAGAGIKVGPFAEGSIRAILNANQDIECSVQYATTTSKGEIKTQGSVYISGNNMRGDFTMTGGGSAATEAHMIRKGDSVVAWTGKQGAKFTLSNFGAQASASASAGGPVSLEQHVSYRCMEWEVEDNRFVVPGDVKIYDIANINIQGVVNVQNGR